MLNCSEQTELGFAAVQTAALPEFIWPVAG
jgi:hypothetical protein